MRLITGGSPSRDRGIAEGVVAVGEPLGEPLGLADGEDDAGGVTGADDGGPWPGVRLGSAPPGPREATGAADLECGVPW
ncbi:hypothetical protein [Actinoallomurus sp. NPDC052274]|uniref:hypothetical protein n=1 Tax=Actinoallomurus sp. NPDC052274 TaxID=3155420 RepID=UPI003421389A